MTAKKELKDIAMEAIEKEVKLADGAETAPKAKKTADKPKTTTKAKGKVKTVSKAEPEETKPEPVQTSEQKQTIYGLDENGEVVPVTGEIEPTTEEPQEVYSAELAKEATKYKNKIRVEYGKVEKSFLNIAISLHWIYDNAGYKPLGYDNIYDFAKKEFDIARGTCCNFINLVERFGARDELGNFTGELAPEYEAYSSSKLILMLNLKDEEIEKLSPTMSVREMKKQIAFLLDKGTDGTQIEEKEATEKFEQAQSYEREAEEATTFKINRQALITCAGEIDYKQKINKIDEFILRAFKAHPDCKIEIVCVTASEVTEAVEDEAGGSED